MLRAREIVFSWDKHINWLSNTKWSTLKTYTLEEATLVGFSRYLYIYLLRNPAARAQTLDWLYDNWQYIETLAGEKSIEDYPRCMSSYINTRAEADKFYNFFDQHSDNPILKRTLTMARASIEAKLNLITNQRQNVYNKLQEVTEK